MDSFILICNSDKRIHTYSISMEDFMIRRFRKERRNEEVTRLGSDMSLCYSGNDIDYDEFLDDIESLLGRDRSRLVLKIADECIQDEDEEDKILARGGRAVDAFYDSCCDVFDDDPNSNCVAVFFKRYNEITNFIYKLCKV